MEVFTGQLTGCKRPKLRHTMSNVEVAANLDVGFAGQRARHAARLALQGQRTVGA